MKKIILTASLTGGMQAKDSNPNLPEQPEEIARAAHDCFNAGAAIVHLHARAKDGKPTGDPAVFRQIHEGIRAKCNVILQDTTGGGPGMSFEDRLSCLDTGPEMASLNMGSMLRTVGPMAGTTFANPRSELERFAKEMLERKIKPEMEIYHHGMLREMHNLIDKGLVKKPYYVNFVMGMIYQGAVDATAKNLTTLIDLLPRDTVFNCTALGASQVPLTTLSVLLGGHARVGMEDNIYYSRGVLAESNAQLVERSVRVFRELGYEMATPDEARDMLAIGQ